MPMAVTIRIVRRRAGGLPKVQCLRVLSSTPRVTTSTASRKGLLFRAFLDTSFISFVLSASTREDAHHREVPLVTRNTSFFLRGLVSSLLLGAGPAENVR